MRARWPWVGVAGSSLLLAIGVCALVITRAPRANRPAASKHGASEHLESLLARLWKSDPETVDALVLAQLKEAGRPAIERLGDFLCDAHPEAVQLRAVRVLRMLDGSSEVLARGMSSSSEMVRFRVLVSLASSGASDEELCGVLASAVKEDLSPRVRVLAANLLLGSELEGVDEVVKDALAGALWDESQEVQRVAASGVGLMGGADVRVVDRLIELSRAEGMGLREECFEALGNLRDYRPQVIEVLVSGSVEEDEAVRALAYGALAGMPGDSADWRGAVEAGLEDSSPHVRRSVVRALRNREEGTELWWPALRKIVREERGSLRLEAAWALASLGVDRQEALKALVAGVKYGPLALDALIALRPQEAWIRRELGRHLAASRHGRAQLVRTMLACGADPDWGRRMLLEELERDSGSVLEVLTALGEMGCGAARALDQIRPFLRHHDRGVRSVARWAMREIEGCPRNGNERSGEAGSRGSADE
jgi:hypothetical protein